MLPSCFGVEALEAVSKVADACQRSGGVVYPKGDVEAWFTLRRYT
jgi:hypothetical protein